MAPEKLVVGRRSSPQSKDAICFSAWQVDSFQGMYMAKFEECTTATPRKMVIFVRPY